ncbi:hypothetical protein PV326_012209 [Microctonus aethiopoides]|uniref:CHK kinase-like domain-containing protein n=1 Tax=Microctonus aethiopoides TaxID=144406 RepID=A0AA39FPA9_9HYME|nr:hypothetical protein PV326_012209 [Microctonus aethiopoides]KAK0173121.1 hypothetical protein PV328_006364 [Microctonus aethiopoides]
MSNRNSENILNDEECREIVRKKLQRDLMTDFSLVSYEIISLDATTGYMGQYFKLKTIVVNNNLPMNKKSINFFMKLPPLLNSPQYKFNEEHESFTKEVDLYTTVFPKIFFGFNYCSIIPECFLGLKNEIIVLEDMAHLGYVMADKFTPLDLNHCIIVMKTLARFHAKSIIYEYKQKKNINDEFSHCLHEALFPIKDGLGRKMFNAAVKGVLSMVDLVTDLNECSKEKLKDKIIILSVNHAKMLLPSKKYKNVLCHGDLWTNNILFEYDSTKKPNNCCLIDFQLARYNPPAHDILCFLQFTTTRKFRDNYADELFKIYYQTLAELLTEVNLDYKIIFPWHEFHESINELHKMCMIHGILNLPLMLLEPQAIDKYFMHEHERLEILIYSDRSPLICGQYRDVKRYRDRMSDAVIELHNRMIKDCCT